MQRKKIIDNIINVKINDNQYFSNTNENNKLYLINQIKRN